MIHYLKSDIHNRTDSKNDRMDSENGKNDRMDSKYDRTDSENGKNDGTDD